jgi:hypothetical protein
VVDAEDGKRKKTNFNKPIQVKDEPTPKAIASEPEEIIDENEDNY